MRTALLLVVLATAGCTRTGASPQEAQVSDAQSAMRDGRFRFEVRGLTSTVEKPTYGGATFTHKATVVAMGDSVLTRGTYFVLLKVKRVGGGDPETPRKDGDFAVVVVQNGVGDLIVSGGYRTPSERWEPEKIEVTPVSAVEWSMLKPVPAVGN